VGAPPSVVVVIVAAAVVVVVAPWPGPVTAAGLPEEGVARVLGVLLTRGEERTRGREREGQVEAAAAHRRLKGLEAALVVQDVDVVL
jgi:hypothetical protein